MPTVTRLERLFKVTWEKVRSIIKNKSSSFLSVCINSETLRYIDKQAWGGQAVLKDEKSTHLNNAFTCSWWRVNPAFISVRNCKKCVSHLFIAIFEWNFAVGVDHTALHCIAPVTISISFWHFCHVFLEDIYRQSAIEHDENETSWVVAALININYLLFWAIT